MNKERFMKNGVFSLEYDKETLRDMVLELQEENKKQKEVIDKVKEFIYIVQNNKDNKHLEPVMSVDELDEILDILKEV